MTSTATKTNETAKPPVAKLRNGRVHATIWERTTSEDIFHTVTFERRYLDKAGEWKSTQSFTLADMPLLADLAEEARIAILNLLSGTGEE